MDAIHIACGKTRRTRRADTERVEIGAFAAQIPRLQHEPDVADTAAARFRVSKRVINDPVINRARLIKVGHGTACDFRRGRFDDADGRQKFSRPPEMIQGCPFLFRSRAGSRRVDCIVFGGHETGERQDWTHARWKFSGDDSEPIGSIVDKFRDPPFGVELV